MRLRLQSRFRKPAVPLTGQGSTPAHIIHEHFCCNRRSDTLTREASLRHGVAGF